MRNSEYKGWTFEHSTPQLGFFSSGRGGKVVRKIWVYNQLFPMVGKWCTSTAEAKRFVDSQK